MPASLGPTEARRGASRAQRGIDRVAPAPPVGIVLFVTCKVGNIDQWTLFKAVIPFLAAEFVVVLLLVLFPPLSNWLPSLV